MIDPVEIARRYDAARVLNSDRGIWRYPRHIVSATTLQDLHKQEKIVRISSPRLGVDDIIPAISELLNPASGWSSDAALETVARSAFDHKGKFERAAVTLVDNPGPATEQAFAYLTDTINGDPLDKSILNSRPRLREWFAKFSSAMRAYAFVVWKAELANGAVSPQADRFASIFENQQNQLIRLYDTLTLDDLSGYISFTDYRRILRGPAGKREGSAAFPLYGTKAENTLLDAQRRAMQACRAIDEQYHEADIKAWEKLKKGWGNKQFQEVLDILPSLKRRITPLNLMLIFETHLLDNVDVGSLSLSPDALNFLLKFKWNERGKIDDQYIGRNYPQVVPWLANNFESQNLSLPRSLFPTVAYEILKNTSSDIAPLVEQAIALGTNLDMNSALVKLLLTLKGEQPTLSEGINSILNEHGLLPDRALQIVTHKAAGSVWVTKEGRIKTADYATTSARNAFPLYRNNIQAEQAEPVQAHPAVVLKVDQPEPLTPQEEEKQKTIDVAESLPIPLWGKVGIATQTVDPITEELAERVWDKDWDQLAAENDILQNRWMAMNALARSNTINPNLATPDQLLHVAGLHDVSRSMRAAPEVGVTGVLRINKSDFLVITDMLASLKGDVIPLALRADLRGDTLKIHGAQDEIGDMYWYMVLQNLILKLSTSSYQLQPTNTDQQAELNTIIAEWNRGARKYLGRIRQGGTNPIIPVYLKQAKTSILVSSA